MQLPQTGVLHSTQCRPACACCAGNLLFEKLSAHTRMAVFNSMMPLEVLSGTTIIKQGDPDATKFYILESGYCGVSVKKPGDAEAKAVHQYKSGRCE